MQGLKTLLLAAVYAASFTSSAPTTSPVARRDNIVDDWKSTSGDGYVPGGSVAKSCLTRPSGTPCPGKLANGNLLITSWNQVVYSQYPNTNMRTRPDVIQHDAARAGYSTDGNGAYPASTLSIFHDFPAGYEGYQCRFHFIYDQGVYIPAIPALFDVWSLQAPPPATLHSTWNSKPARVESVAVFNATGFVEGAIAEDAAESKMSAPFLSGPGEGSPAAATFACPAGGSYAWEIAADPSIPVDTQTAIDQYGPFNCGGNNGLAIEVVGVKNPYW